jgi:lipoprotein-anchoring transpeptidase ErfK/SrfK
MKWLTSLVVLILVAFAWVRITTQTRPSGARTPPTTSPTAPVSSQAAPPNPPTAPANPQTAPANQQAAPTSPQTAPANPELAAVPCGDPFAFQVLLDRQGFSPGQIDGKFGKNVSHAVSALQQARKLMVTGQPDCDTWRALGGDTAGPMTVAYTVTADDVSGPFTKTIPRDLVEQANLPELGYTSALEALGERFHVAPSLLQQMNNRAQFVAGQQIQVPAVTPFDPNAKPSHDPAADDVVITVSRDESSVRASHADGTLMFFAPVTTGSEHDPLPPGNWKVVGVQWRPVFHYNPALFWDAKPEHSAVEIKPGPNNPVGVVWIALSLEHYGLHGSPEPGNIGHTESHGCVRLTNWDVAHLAALVQPGTPVIFR